MAEGGDNKNHRLQKLTASVNSKSISKKYKKAENATLRHARRFLFKRLDNFREARRFVAMWVLFVGLIIGATGIQFLWYQNSYKTSASSRSGTYTEAVQGPLDTLNPLYADTSAEESVSRLVFSRLLRHDFSGNINYDLAEKMELSEDKQTYTVSIRPDARWHDGLYVRAKDVVFTVGLVKNDLVRSNISGWASIKVKEIDSKTVSFELPSVYAPFPQALEQLPILPEHILRDIDPSQLRESSFSNNPIGSGPFAARTVQDVGGSSRKVVHLVRNEDFYRGRINLDRFQLYVYESVDSLKNAVKSGEVTAATGFSVTDVEDFNQSRYEVTSRPTNSGVYAIFNNSSAMLSDIKVRQALQSGTDMNKVRQALGEDTVPLHLPFISDQVSGEVPAEVKYDLSHAKKLLDEAGWVLDGTERKKGDKSLQLSVVSTKNNDYEKVLGELASQWRSLGITVTTNIVDSSDPSQNVVQDILQPRKYDVLLYSLTIGGDPDVFLYWHSTQANGGYNFANYKNPISDEALITARTRVEPELRDAKYITFAKQWLNDAPALGIYQSTVQYVHTHSVRSSNPNIRFVSSVDRYGDVMDWSVGSRQVYKTP